MVLLAEGIGFKSIIPISSLDFDKILPSKYFVFIFPVSEMSHLSIKVLIIIAFNQNYVLHSANIRVSYSFPSSYTHFPDTNEYILSDHES